MTIQYVRRRHSNELILILWNGARITVAVSEFKLGVKNYSRDRPVYWNSPYSLVLPGIAIFPLGCWLYCTDSGKRFFWRGGTKVCLRCAGMKVDPPVYSHELTDDDVNLIVDYESRKGRMDAASFRNDDGELFGDNAWVLAINQPFISTPLHHFS